MGKKGVNRKHGLTGHPLYIVWTNMKRRCYYIDGKDYPRYGGRGVTVCDEWKNDFQAFYIWAVKNGWRHGLQLDKDSIPQRLGIPNIIYSPEMCQFVTCVENSNNRHTNRWLTFNGKTQTMLMWSRELGISDNTLWSRLNQLHWSVEKSLTQKNKRKLSQKP